ncbi:TonB-dependent receptor [Gluconobacter sp. OJB]|uniref:TonB-dependent receptor n=1 Tax=Gluconobacter sp. OJB TaxID=3145196 RepID=UPI0031F8D595
MTRRIDTRFLSLLLGIGAIAPVVAWSGTAQADTTESRNPRPPRPAAQKVSAHKTAPINTNASVPEQITVVARTNRGRTPGAGLLPAQTEARAVQEVTREYIAKQSPTNNIQQLLTMLPGANISNTDPYGLYNGAANVRGFAQTDIGWTLDGVPLNDIGGGGFYAQEVLEAEDLCSVSLIPGGVDLDSPTVNAAGGLVKATMCSPTQKRGALMDVSFGAYDMKRQFIRLNSGEIGNTGVRGMFSFSHTTADNWRGAGGAEKFHYDFKAIKEFESGSSIGLMVSYNDQTNDNYLYPSLTAYEQSGYSNNYTPSYAGANATGAKYYKLYVNPFRDVIASAPIHVAVTPSLSIDETPYIWYGSGSGSGGLFANSSNLYYGGQKADVTLNGTGSSAVVFVPGTSVQLRPGNTLKLRWHVDNHNIFEIGWWYEYSNEVAASSLARVNQSTGEPYDIWGTQGLYTLPNGRPYSYRNILTLTQANMLFLGDSMNYFNDRLHIDLGFKEAMVTRRTYNYVPGTTYNRNLHTALPLPSVGASWRFNKEHQIYINGTTNFRMPSNTSLVDYRNNMSASLSQVGGSSQPEYSIAEEIGYRYSGKVVSGSISFFNYNLTNRQLSLLYYDNGSTYMRTVNAGGQTSRGVDIQVATRPILYHLRPYVSFEYLDARIGNNIQTTGTLNEKTVVDYLPTKGKIQIQSPKVQAAFGLDYDDGKFFFNGQIKYIGSQYSTFMDDNKIPGYITDSIALGYRLPNLGIVKSPQIQVNMSNLTGAHFRNGVYTFQTNAKATKGVYGSTISGRAPAYYLQPPFVASVTLSAGF